MSVIVEGPFEGEFRWSLIVPEDGASVDLDAELAEAVTGHPGTIQLWIREVDATSDEAALGLGFERHRDLWQLRCRLPAAPATLPTRGFTDDDLFDFIRLNNRAFAWHPEQGGLTVEAVRATMAEPWFDPDGFRLYREEGVLVGFCWTKIHAHHNPPLGEIYVIAIDPDHHGLGLGKPMTLAGLDWLAHQGLSTGMLYVESDNEAANATSAAIGFARHHPDPAYRLDRS